MKVWDYQIIFLSSLAQLSYARICKTAAVLLGLVQTDREFIICSVQLIGMWV